ATGTISNAGTINAFASVVGGTGNATVTTGVTAAAVVTGIDSAQAVGIHVNGSQNLATVSNSGTISVSAVNDGADATATGPSVGADPVVPVAATGILFTGAGTAPATGTAVINNSGTIF